MGDIVNRLQREQKSAYQRYLYAKEAYEECRGYHYDCYFEKDEKDSAWDNLKAIESDLRDAKEIFYKASDWIKSFNHSCQVFQSFSGNCSQDSVRYLDQLLELAQKYIFVSTQYQEVGESSDSSMSSSSNRSAKASVKEPLASYSNQIEFSKESETQLINFCGNKFFLKTISSKTPNKKEFTTWNIASKGNPDENFLSLKMDNETKHATLGDVKTRDAFWNLSKESHAICLMENVAKKEGCKIISSWISIDQIPFFVANGYRVTEKHELGAEILKELL